MEQKTLGRIVNHDTRSLTFAFDTTGLVIKNVKHERHIGILDQTNVGRCTGNAGVGSIASTPLFEKLPPKPYYSLDEDGATKLYSDAEIIDGGIGYPPQDVGSSGLSVAKALYNAGLISGYQHTFTLEDALKAGTLYPFITGINWYSDMFTTDTDGRVHPTGTIAGGHEIQMDEIDADNGRIWFCNSWNENWGVKGRFYLTWEDYASLLSEKGDVTILFPLVVVPPPPVYKTLKLGSTGDLVITLQTILNQNGATLKVDGNFGPKTKAAVVLFQVKNGLVSDGIVGPKTWAVINKTPSIVDIITNICNANGVEPILGIAVATAESGLNPRATLYNKPSNSTDRGLFQWNDKYHPEITDALAFDPMAATRLFCDAVKAGKLHAYWSASEPVWKKMLTPELLLKYHIA